MVLGAALAQALGDRSGIARFGDAAVPMDESLATAVVDVGGRPYAVIDLPFRGKRAGELPLQLIEHVFESFARAGGVTIHVKGRGRNDHHLAEAAFKALGRSLRAACAVDPRRSGVRLDKGIAGLMAAGLAPVVAVLDYGAANLASIGQALVAAGARVVVATDAAALEGVAAIVVPGVGAAGPAMAHLRERGLVEPLRAWVRAGRPCLGICLGYQLLFERSAEGDAQTLGLLAGRTVGLEDAPTLPHIGWNTVELARPHPLFDGIADGSHFYFVHSFAPAPADEGIVVARTTHGRPFVSAVASGSLYGLQFHPEKSAEQAGGCPTSCDWSPRPRRHRDRGRRRGRGLRPGACVGGGVMLARRVIPCLDVAKGRVVKGTRFVDLTDEGDPAELAERYAREGADEVVFLDITAAPEGRGTMLEVVRRAASRAFVPLTVGGGVRSVDEMRDVLRAGADKVSFNTAAVANPQLLTACAVRFGSQAVVCAIDARRSPQPSEAALGAPIAWEVVTHGGRKPAGLDATEWAQRAVDLGAGELLVTSMDRDGTRSGFDTELLRAISSRVRVPVIASGGASGPQDFVVAVRDGGVDAVLAASIFHRRLYSIDTVKQAMAAAGLPVRPVGEAAA